MSHASPRVRFGRGQGTSSGRGTALCGGPGPAVLEPERARAEPRAVRGQNRAPRSWLCVRHPGSGSARGRRGLAKRPPRPGRNHRAARWRGR